MKANAMTSLEKRSISGLSLIFALRMLGLFMILPVFSVAAEQYTNSTPMLIGLAIGAYGLTQAFLQIPFGMLSDRIGRKKVIYLGLTLFAIGSVVAALAQSIEMVIVGRLLQGSGAVAAAIMALIADLTRDEQRSKAMASIGMSIGLSFSIAFVAGTELYNWIGLSGIFWATAGFSVLGMCVLKFWVPSPKQSISHIDSTPVPEQFGKLFRNIHIMRLVFSILTLHMILTATFFALPRAMHNDAALNISTHTWIYLGILVAAFISMVPFIIIAEKKRKMKTVFLGAIATIGVAELIWGFLPHSATLILIGLWLFFTGFNILEASLPSMISKLSPLRNKGTAMGMYSTAQFVGAFLGGGISGTVFQFFGLNGVFLACAVTIAIWLALMLSMKQPRHYSSRILPLNDAAINNVDAVVSELHAVKGIVDTIVVPEEKVAYIKYDADETTLSDLDNFAFSK